MRAMKMMSRLLPLDGKGFPIRLPLGTLVATHVNCFWKLPDSSFLVERTYYHQNYREFVVPAENMDWHGLWESSSHRFVFQFTFDYCCSFCLQCPQKSAIQAGKKNYRVPLVFAGMIKTNLKYDCIFQTIQNQFFCSMSICTTFGSSPLHNCLTELFCFSIP